jgi:transposase
VNCWPGSTVFGSVARVGIEGTSSCGAGLARWLRSAGVDVVEVDRPNRQSRRRTGKSDPASQSPRNGCSAPRVCHSQGTGASHRFR